MKKLKKRWGITSNFQLVTIFLVFALNGSIAVGFAKPLLNFLGITLDTLPPFLFWTLRILVMFVTYQVFLIILGTLFGQKDFFWSMEKKMLSRIGFKRFFK
ncbi:DUF6787 family protein [Aquimarina sediminis]|uniref:DUF6787 family protein n=1 Tax=Aquimarina sediminis TaxID=2070536 RepID=UPI000CA073AC|nr:DUF6787 family protein [Aquimarina sediminis]